MTVMRLISSQRGAIAACLAALFVLNACTVLGPSRAPVSTQSSAGSKQGASARKPVRATDRPALYKVRVGDTLYAIAWRYGFDYRELARWNLIDAPYVIFPGQPLVLSDAGTPSRRTAARPVPVKPAVARAPRQLRWRPRPRMKPASVKRLARRKPSVGSTQKRASNQSQPVRKTTSAQAAKADTNAPVKRWQWPAAGRLLRNFTATRKTGIDISGAGGQPVVAAADGRVVYSGSGLRGYGQLLIVKHNNRFLSAYAHNERLHTAEGEWVVRGERIAQMGSTGNDRVMLHFEIRRDGKPVNPLSYLPKNSP
jgi:lipoprotein NlpD